MARELKTTTFEVGRMDCAGCARKIDKALRAIDGVVDVSLHHPDTVLGVLHEPRLAATDIGSAVSALGFVATPVEPGV